MKIAVSVFISIWAY